MGTAIIDPKSMSELLEFANAMSKSGLVPNDYQGKPNNIVVAVQWGSEIGLAPMQALQNISVINGRATVWGDSALALVAAHPLFLGIDEHFEGETAVCIVKRKLSNGEVQETRREFSIDMAKKAGLWGRKGPWTSYPNRMLQMRARGFALRDGFPDAMKGMITTEEGWDTPPEEKQSHTKVDKVVNIGDGAVTSQEILEAVGEAETPTNDAEQLGEGEVVVSPTEQEQSETEASAFVLNIPRCEPESYDDEASFCDRYHKLMSSVVEATTIDARSKMTKLRELEQANKPLLESMATGIELLDRRIKLNKKLGAELKETGNE